MLKQELGNTHRWWLLRTSGVTLSYFTMTQIKMIEMKIFFFPYSVLGGITLLQAERVSRIFGSPEAAILPVVTQNQGEHLIVSISTGEGRTVDLIRWFYLLLKIL